MKRLRRGTMVQRASRLVPVVVVLDKLGIANSGTPPEGVSLKVECPFQEGHPPDRSGEKDMRIYSDGKAFCHMCAEGWDSVHLAARVWELSLMQAARHLLALQGIEVSDDDRESLAVKATPAQLRASAVAALAVWADANDINRFSAAYAKCLQAADDIVSEEHVDAWLTACQNFLRRAFRA